jgi:uncharacterized protein involved in exopolysaccharide biosynthesis
MMPLNFIQDPANQDPLWDGVSLASGYAVRAFKRHLFVAAVTGVGTLALVAVLLAIIPPTYKVETRILAKSSDIMPLLTATGTVLPGHTEPSPTAGATELVKSRETLTWLVGELNLVDRWENTRTSFGRFVDGVLGRALGPAKADARYEALLKVLADRITAALDGDVVTISVEWHEPEGALLIANALKDHFLVQLREAEAGQIKATVSLLEERQGRTRVALADATKALQDAAEEANSTTAKLFKLHRPNVDPDVETVARLQAELDLKKEALHRAEAAYDARVADATLALNKTRATLGAGNPDVIDAQRNLAQQMRVPQELSTLREDEENLSRQLTHMVPALTAAGLFEKMAYAQNVDAGLETARERYHQASEAYTDATKRLEGAKTELASADASFPFRYRVTVPPVAPHGPAKPDVPLVLISGFVAALLLGFVTALLADLTSKRIQEPWQIVRYVGIPVIGQVRGAEG